MEPNLDEILNKQAAGAELTPEERQAIMSEPPPNAIPDVKSKSALDPDEDEDEDDDKKSKKDVKTSEHVEKTDEATPTGDKGTPNKKDPDATAKTGDDVDMDKIRQDLDRPEEEVDVKQYSPRELGIMKELRKERKERQDLQRKLDQEEFAKKQRELKDKLDADAKKDEEELAKILEGREDDDVLSVGEAKKLMQHLTKSTVSAKAAAPAPDTATSPVELENYAFKAYMSDSDPETFALASEHMETLLAGNTDAMSQIANAKKNGENPVAVAVSLVRKHPKWTEIAETAGKKKPAAAKSETTDTDKENRERLDRIKKNGDKTKTLGPGGSSTEVDDEYTLEELARMDPDEFARLPKTKRDELLKKFGSHPNQV